MVLVGLLSLLAGAVVLLGMAPVVVTRGRWRVRSPRFALALSHGLTLAAVGCAAATLVWTLATVTSGADASGSTAFWLEPTTLTLFAWVGLAALGGLFTVIFTSAEPMSETDHRIQVEFSLLAVRGTAFLRDGVSIVVVPTRRPIALSVPGERPQILVGSALEEMLSENELRAVIEHERAHLVQHHGMLTRLARLNSTCAAFLPVTNELERCTRMLVELIADDTAARHAGAVNLANALWKVGTATDDEAMVVRAHRIASHPPRGSSTSSRRVWRSSNVAYL